MSINIAINTNSQEIVDLIVEVVTLLLQQKMGLFLVIGAAAVVGFFFLIVFGVCFGMCCYAFTKRRSKRLCLSCMRFCYDKCCGDHFNFEEGKDTRDEEQFMMGNGKIEHVSQSFGSSDDLEKNGRGTPV